MSGWEKIYFCDNIKSVWRRRRNPKKIVLLSFCAHLGVFFTLLKVYGEDEVSQQNQNSRIEEKGSKENVGWFVIHVRTEGPSVKGVSGRKECLAQVYILCHGMRGY